MNYIYTKYSCYWTGQSGDRWKKEFRQNIA